MVNKLVHLRIPDKLYQDSALIIEENGFASFQEFVKHCLRKEILGNKQGFEESKAGLGGLEELEEKDKISALKRHGIH